jgi:thiamine biosynthesis protein ThiS
LRVHVNGEGKELVEGVSLSDLIKQLDLPIQRIAVELNREVVRRSEWDKTTLKSEDRIEIVHFVGGGASVRLNNKMSVESSH